MGKEIPQFYLSHYLEERISVTYQSKIFKPLFQVSGLEDIYVFDGGLVSLDTNGSIATNHVPAIVSLKSLHVQDKGTFQLKAYHDAYTWDIDSTNITVSSIIFV